jgi:hypothetical protein
MLVLRVPIFHHFAPFLADFFKGKWLKMKISPTTGPNDSNTFAMMFVYYKDPKTLQITQFGPVSDLR